MKNMPLSPEEKKLLERIYTAFQHYNCFIYEKKEHDHIMELLEKTELKRRVKIEYADPRYPYIYIMKPRTDDLHRKCLMEIERLFHNGQIKKEDYMVRRDELIRQCINHYTFERAKEIISHIEKILKGDNRVNRNIPEIPI